MKKSQNIQLKKYFNLKKEDVNKRLSLILKNENALFELDNFNDSTNYTLSGGGKRIRPILTIAIYELFNDNTDEIIDLACAIELIHTASLILDDLPSMDDAKIRRGKDTNHIVHGESTAILASAGLWIRAFEVIAKVQNDNALDLVKLTTELTGREGLILGQYVDLFAARLINDIDGLNESYRLKTGSLFTLASRFGGLVGGATTGEQKLLDEYVLNIGMAFQIRDDIIDVTQGIDESGKDINKDSENNKPNYISYLNENTAKINLNKHIADAKNNVASLNKNSKLLENIADYLSL